MSRIAIPSTIEAAPAAAQPLLEGVKKQLGVAPNLFRLVATSPAALEAFVGMLGALGKGALPAATRARIALAIAEVNGCGYCLAAHTYLGKNVNRLDDAEMDANRDGTSRDPKAAAAVRFAVQIAQARGRIDDADLGAVKAAGYDDAQIIEMVMHVALNIWTNYLNLAVQTDLDFPAVTARRAA